MQSAALKLVCISCFVIATWIIPCGVASRYGRNTETEAWMGVIRFLSTLALGSRPEKIWRRRRLGRKNAQFCRLCVEPLETRMMPAGTWQPLAPTNPASGPTDTDIALLLSDGTLMIQPKTTSPNNVWYRLAPDATGNYVTGTWSALASMSEQRYVFSSALLPDGRVFVLGGRNRLLTRLRIRPRSSIRPQGRKAPGKAWRPFPLQRQASTCRPVRLLRNGVKIISR